MWLNVLAVKLHFTFSCLYGRWKCCCGNFDPKNKVNAVVLLEINCKINSSGGAKIPYFVHK